MSLYHSCHGDVGSNATKREEVASLLKIAATRLEEAENHGKDADRLLKQARAQGDKESSKFLKYYKYAKDANPSAATAVKK